MQDSAWLDSMAKWDEATFRFINGSLHHDWLNWLMIAVSAKSFWFSLLAIWVFYIFFKRRFDLLGKLVFLGVGMGGADYFAYKFIKPLFARPRPCKVLEFINLLEGCASWNSFPSNHATNAMVAAVIVYCVISKGWGGVLFCGALLVGISRVYLGMHYPFDILGGFILGGLWALCLVSFWHGFRKLWLIKKSRKIRA